MVLHSRLKLFLVLGLTLAMAACGGTTSPDGNGGNSGDGGANPGSGSTPSAAGVKLIAETPTLASAADSADNGIELTAIVRDSDNNVVQGQRVSFAATSGVIQVNNDTTQQNGTASAILYTGGDPANRSITVTASAGNQNDAIDVQVTGTSIMVSGPQAISANGQAAFTATLTDSDNKGIANQPIAVNSARGNNIASSMLQTNAQGVARFTVNPTTTGEDTVSAEALGASRSVKLNVGGANFAFSAPDTDTEVKLNESVPIVLNWRNDNGPVTGEPVRFSSSRGQFDQNRVDTDSNGNATVTLSSSDAGLASVTATDGNGRSATLQLRFVATVADSVIAQADPATVNTGGDSTITATVRDDNNNLVTGATVLFSLQDTSGGRIQPSQQKTNEAGQASATYTAGNTSAGEPAVVTVRIAGDSAIADDVSIVVGGRALRITLGTGDEVKIPNTTTYKLPYVALVTDAAGNPIQDANFQLNVRSVSFQEGTKTPEDIDGDGAADAYTPMYQVGGPSRVFGIGCANEDVNANGILDPSEDSNDNGVLDVGEDTNDNGILDPSEDTNGNSKLDPGNVATVPRTLDLDDTGTAEFDVTYPKNFSGWVKVRLRTTASVQGSETNENVFFVLPLGADDHDVDGNSTPPGLNSPFGVDGDCATGIDPQTGEER